jgi:hypothetical protein
LVGYGKKAFHKPPQALARKRYVLCLQKSQINFWFYNSKMTNQNIENIKNFVAKTLVKEEPHHKCLTMCYILSVYMDIYNIKHVIKSGVVETIGHYIIALKNNDYKIVDPTAKQINRRNPRVLIQKKEHPYSEFNEIKLKDRYDEWEYLLLHDGFKKPMPTIILQNSVPDDVIKIEIVPYIRILLRAYLIFKELTSELEQIGVEFPAKTVNQYFKRFEKIANKNKDKKGKLDNTFLNKKFDELLTSLKI